MPKRKPKKENRSRVKVSDLRKEIDLGVQTIAIRDKRIEQLAGQVQKAERNLIDPMAYLGQQADDAKVIAEVLDAHGAVNATARVMTMVTGFENHRRRIAALLNGDRPMTRQADDAKAA